MRIGGLDRYATAVSLSQFTHPRPSSPKAYLFPAVRFTDALALGPIAAHEDAVLLPVHPAGLSEVVELELQRLRPSEIVLVGAASALPPEVEVQAGEYAGQVIRVREPDRCSTAVALSRRHTSHRSGARTVHIAADAAPIDAVLACPLAAAARGVVLLVHRDEIPPAVRRELTRLRPERIVIVGDETVVSKRVGDELAALAPTTRIGGADRYDTAVAVVEALIGPATTDMSVVLFSRSMDGVIAACFAASRPTSLLLPVEPDTVPAAVAAELTRRRPSDAVLIGGENVLTPALERSVDALMAPD